MGKSGINSYHLNNTGQFALNTDYISIFVINNDNNAQTWKEFKEQARDRIPYYTRQSIRKVQQLTDIEKHLFKDNEFHYFRPVIDQIMVIIDIFKNNKSKYVMILKDNIILTKDFHELFAMLKGDIEYEFISLDEQELDDNKNINIIKKQIKINLETSNGFIISETGIKKILAYVTMNRIKNLNYLDNCDILESYILNKSYYHLQKELHSINLDHEYVKLDGYKFYSQMDSFGEDIGYHGRKSVEELKTICDKANGVCFNTLGYIKGKVVAEKDFIHLPYSTRTGDGLYIKI